MNSAIRKILVLACGFVAVAALGVPAAAQAATDTATTTGVSPSISPTECFQNFTLQDIVTNDVDEINSTTSRLYFGGGTKHPLCQAIIDAVAGTVMIYTASSGYCLAFDSADNQVYQHVPAGCVTTGAPPSYTEWKFLVAFSDPGFSPTEYEIQSLYNGECIQGGNPATLGSCSALSDDVYILQGP